MAERGRACSEWMLYTQEDGRVRFHESGDITCACDGSCAGPTGVHRCRECGVRWRIANPYTDRAHVEVVA